MFGDILSKSWSEFKDNFWIFFWGILLLSFIPGLLIGITQSMYAGEAIQNFNLMGSNSVDLSAITSSPYFYPSLGLTVISILLGVYLSASLISLSLSKKKLTFGETFALGKKNFWRFLGFSIILMLFLMGLAILLIIPMIIFAVYWAFAPYIFIEEKKGIMESLGKSHNLIRGKWWRVLGNFILLILIFLLIAIGASIISGILRGIFGISLLTLLHPTAKTLLITNIIASVTGFISGIFTTPLMILFTKNLYYDFAKKK